MENMITNNANFDLYEIPSDVLENMVKGATDISEEMDRVVTVKWFEDILGWYSNIVERDEQGNGYY